MLLLTDTDKTGEIPKLLSRYRDGTDPAPLPDATLQLSPSDSAAQDRFGRVFLRVRIAVDLLRDEQFARSFLNHARGSGPQMLRIDTQQFHPTPTEYAGLVIRLLRTTHVEAQRRTANPILGEVDPFIAATGRMIFGEDPQDRTRARTQRIGGSYAIVNKVTKDFDKSIFPAAERNRMGIRERFETRAQALGKRRKWPWQRGERWSRSPSFETWLEDAFIGFLADVQKALHRKLAGQDSLLATHEKAGVEERKDQARRMTSELNLGLFGTGERAKDNFGESTKTIGAELEDIETDIAKFWSDFADGQTNEDGDEPLTKAAVLVRDHCPLMRREWPETSELITRFDEARKSFDDLMSRPTPWLWLAGSAALFLLLPALWTALRWQAFTTQAAIPALSIGVWIAMFLMMLRGPWWVLARGHRKVEKSLVDLGAAALKVLEAIEQRLENVVRYVGIIQRHNFLHSLNHRIHWLAGEASLVDEYLNNVEESFGANARKLASRPGADDDVANLVDRLRKLPECRQWLDLALRNIALEGAVELRAGLSGGVDIRAPTRFLEQPVVVRIEPQASAAEAS